MCAIMMLSIRRYFYPEGSRGWYINDRTCVAGNGDNGTSSKRSERTSVAWFLLGSRQKEWRSSFLTRLPLTRYIIKLLDIISIIIANASVNHCELCLLISIVMVFFPCFEILRNICSWVFATWLIDIIRIISL